MEKKLYKFIHSKQQTLLIDPLLLTKMELMVVRMLKAMRGNDDKSRCSSNDEDFYQKMLKNVLIQEETHEACYQSKEYQICRNLSLAQSTQSMTIHQQLVSTPTQTKAYMFFTQNNSHISSSFPPQIFQQQESKIQGSYYSQQSTIEVMGQKRTILQIKRHNGQIKEDSQRNNNMTPLGGEEGMMMSNENNQLNYHNQNQQQQQHQHQQMMGQRGINNNQLLNNKAALFILSQSKRKENQNNNNNNDNKNKDKKSVFNTNTNLGYNNNTFSFGVNKHIVNQGVNNNNKVQVNCANDNNGTFKRMSSGMNLQKALINNNKSSVKDKKQNNNKIDNISSNNNNNNNINININISNNPISNFNINPNSNFNLNFNSTHSTFPITQTTTTPPLQLTTRQQQRQQLNAEQKQKIVRKKIQKRKRQTRRLLLDQKSQEQQQQSLKQKLNQQYKSYQNKESVVNNNRNVANNNNNNWPLIRTPQPQNAIPQNVSNIIENNSNNKNIIQHNLNNQSKRDVRLQSNNQLNVLINNYNHNNNNNNVINNTQSIPTTTTIYNQYNQCNQYNQPHHIPYTQQQHISINMLNSNSNNVILWDWYNIGMSQQQLMLLDLLYSNHHPLLVNTNNPYIDKNHHKDNTKQQDHQYNYQDHQYKQQHHQHKQQKHTNTSKDILSSYYLQCITKQFQHLLSISQSQSQQLMQSILNTTLTLQQFLQVIKHTYNKLITQLKQQSIKIITKKQQISSNKLQQLMQTLQTTISKQLYQKLSFIISNNSDNNMKNNNKKNNNSSINSVQELRVQQLKDNQLRLYQLIKGYVSSNVNNSAENIKYPYYHYHHYHYTFESILNQYLVIQKIDNSYHPNNIRNNESTNKTTINTQPQSAKNQPLNQLSLSQRLIQELSNQLDNFQQRSDRLQQVVNSIIYDLGGQKKYNYMINSNVLISCQQVQKILNINAAYNNNSLASQLYIIKQITQHVQKELIKQNKSSISSSLHFLYNSIQNNYKEQCLNTSSLMIDQQQLQQQTGQICYHHKKQIQVLVKSLDNIISDLKIMDKQLNVIQQTQL